MNIEVAIEISIRLLDYYVLSRSWEPKCYDPIFIMIVMVAIFGTIINKDHKGNSKIVEEI